ncbi:AAA family ATPase [Tsukamurella spumae]|uniref:AAA family ATPase n=1 Tax=Tsukamurella spumae TaxID=44753 RepID=A0A846WX00_9ACTN|nr:AAA family ATPase [Tsukamurella spumae]NKY17523.1 AAA family ATPase [Tsukamurella spumae]
MTNDSRVFTWVSGTDVKPVRVDWWENYLIPRGCLTVPAGRGNAGKSTACAAWAAQATRQGETVAWLHSEEDRGMHITPKLLAADADLELVKFLDVGIRMDDGTISEAALQLPRDIDRLEEGLVEMGCRFVVFDALTSFKSSRMSANSGDDVRAFLEPIQRMAGRLNAVVLGIAHLGKDGERKARDAVKGASEWTDVPRQVLAFHRNDGETDGVISDVKGNLSPSPRSIGYRFESVSLPEHGIEEVGRVVFTGDVDTTVDEARRSSASDEGDDDDRSAALRWVEDYLEENGESDAAVVKRLCSKELCISIRTVERSIKVKVSRVVAESKGFPRKAFWRLANIVEGEVISSDTDTGDSGRDTPNTLVRVATVATGSEQQVFDVATGVATGEILSSDTPGNSVGTGVETAVIGQWKGSGKAVTAALQVVPDPDTPRTCRQWFDTRIRELIDSGQSTAVSRDIYSEGTAAGWSIDNLRQCARKSTLVAVAEKHSDGSTTWALGEGVQATHVSASQWLAAFLGERDDWVRSTEAYAAGQAAGYGRDAIKSASLAAHVLKRGQSTLTEWSLDPTYERESA